MTAKKTKKTTKKSKTTLWRVKWERMSSKESREEYPQFDVGPCWHILYVEAKDNLTALGFATQQLEKKTGSEVHIKEITQADRYPQAKVVCQHMFEYLEDE